MAQFDCLLFYIEHGFTVLCIVRLIRHTVEAQIHGRQPAEAQRAGKVFIFCQLYSVGVQLDIIKAYCPGSVREVAYILSDGRLPAAEFYKRVISRKFLITLHQSLALLKARLMQRLILVARKADGAVHVAAVRRHKRGRRWELTCLARKTFPAGGFVRFFLILRQPVYIHPAVLQPAQIVLRAVRPYKRGKTAVLRAGFVHIYPAVTADYVRVYLLQAHGTHALCLI